MLSLDQSELQTGTVEKHHFIRWREASESRQLQSEINWGRIKGLDRSIEKALRVYKQVNSVLEAV